MEGEIERKIEKFDGFEPGSDQGENKRKINQQDFISFDVLFPFW